MKQVIDEILQEEKKARERVEAAREEAKAIRLNADKEAKTIMDQSRSKTQDQVKTLLEKARTEAEIERDTILSEAKQAGDALWKEKAGEIDRMVDRLFQIIITKSETE